MRYPLICDEIGTGYALPARVIVDHILIVCFGEGSIGTPSDAANQRVSAHIVLRNRGDTVLDLTRIVWGWTGGNVAPATMMPEAIIPVGIECDNLSLSYSDIIADYYSGASQPVEKRAFIFYRDFL